MIHVEIHNEQSHVPVVEERLRAVVAAVLAGEGIADGEISLAIVDDEVIRAVHHRWLHEDEPTDCMSFVLDSRPGYVEGEIVASAETAARTAHGLGSQPELELLLYVAHGALHLAGHDDRSDEDRRRMRQAERRYLAPFGAVPEVE